MDSTHDFVEDFNERQEKSRRNKKRQSKGRQANKLPKKGRR